jgi:two-component system CheB/CheR fusion protein
MSSSSHASRSFPIVGIGASAGGLEAFRRMLSELPANARMAYILVLHLPVDHVSMLSEILGRASALPVTELADDMRLEPDHVYVLPAGRDLEVRDGVALLSRRAAQAGQHRPIDHFFHSLAENQSHRAIGVILSGTASDGALGIQEIKAAGGITFAQDGSAEQSSMPRSAIQTGAVDFVLDPADIARELARIATHPIVASEVDAQSEEVPDLTPVIDELREVMGVDFSHYKPNTLYRRIARRIVLHKLEGLTEYVKLLRSSPAETESLYQDVLINVTKFFRDPEAFDALKKEVFPALTNNRSRHDPIRVWTLACSTGEEAYSIAMAFAEFAEELGRPVPLQVFATDLNAASVERARAAVYPRTAVSELNVQRVRRFFVEVDGSYRIAKPIRDACIFARHNVLADPPFSRVDLVSCRNMLIYLGTELQQKVIPILHYALQPSGYLWLGTSETIGSYRELFELKNTRYKIYAKRGAPAHLPISVTAAAVAPSVLLGRSGPGAVPVEPRPLDAQKEIDRLLIARYAPASVLVRSNLEIIQYRGNTAPYLAPAPGRASLSLLKMLREGLLLGVRSALERAKSEEMPVRQEGLVISSGESSRKVNVEVIPVRSGVDRADLFLVLFEDPPEPPPRQIPASFPEAAADAAAQEIGQLKQELAATREYLQSVIEQQEAANEELQSANEEVQSANEELQSINEELETSKEEVQSSNEELATVNDELHGRNAELAQTNNDLVNLLSSVQMAIVMLGPTLRIRRFTPMAERLLNLIPTDVGRPVSDIKVNFDVPELDQLVSEAVEKVEVREREVRDRHGRWYLLRIRPYRTLENKIDGAVIVLIDVDSLKRSQEMLRQQTELLNQAHEPIVMWELDGYASYWNKAAEETYGFSADQAIGRKTHELLLTTPPFETFRDELAANGHWTGELVHTRRDGQKIIVESRMVIVTDTAGRKLVVEANRPITHRKESERILRSLADNLVAADRQKDEFLAMLAHELRNPLAPLRNIAMVLRSEHVADDQKLKALGMMERQVASMARLIDDLLDVSRITLSQIELKRERVDIAAIARRVAEQHEGAVRAKQQSLAVDVPQQPAFVDGDEVRLEQILGNVVDNASKYTQVGGHIRVSVETDSEVEPRTGDGGSATDEIVVRVRDNGIGIDAEKLPRVFDMFMRATRSIDQQYGGLGIGLTLVRRLVELHGGRVEAHSAGAKAGSEFVIRLPAYRPGRASAHAPTAPYEPPQQLAKQPRRRVLVVDDVRDNADALAMALVLAGHEVTVAHSGREALDVAKEFRPDVALIDLGMPDIDGCTLARALKSDGAAGLRLVALTGYGHTAARDDAQSAGFDDYLVKPAGAEDLERALGSR